MLKDAKRYSEFKDSGSPWIGKVPAHWKINSLGSMLVGRNQRNRPDLPLLSVARERGVYLRGKQGEDENHNVIPEDLSNYKVAMQGDLVINKMKAWQGSMGIAPCNGIVSPAYFVYRFRMENSNFGKMLLRSKPYVAHFARASDGVRIGQWDLTISEMKRIPVLCPPSDEQEKIVRFLDWANNRLDRAIRAKKKVIALLNEQKQAIIHRAVTRGIDPNVKMKDSGIPWLGEIPEHWILVAVRRFWTVTDCKHLTVPFTEIGIPIASVVQVQSFYLDLSKAKRTTKKYSQLLVEGDRKPARGDLIYCRNASVGACAFVNTDEEFSMGQDVCLIRSKEQNQKYLNYCFHSKLMDTQLQMLLVGSTFKRINVADIKALLVVVPPRQEQDLICSYLDERILAFDKTIGKVEREIEFTKEYRNRLSSEVLTGKVDVHKVASKLSANDFGTDSTDAGIEFESIDEEAPEDVAA